MSKDTLIFVDNGFFRLVQKEFESKLNKKTRFLKSFRNFCENENLNLKHLFFYTAPPYQSEKSSEKEIVLKRNYDNLSRLLGYKKWITLREGRCQRLKVDGNFKYSQKGVDILLAMDLMRFDRTFQTVKKIILIICDSDFVPAINRLKEEGIEVIVYTYFDRIRGSPFSRYNELLGSASRWVKLRKEDFI
mgnify:FL=1|jgi:uncharacterized LabA/DUF88 family protein